MNKIILFSTILIQGLLGIISCNDTVKKKLETAENKVIETKEDLDTAKMEYDVELANYRAEATEKISANDKQLQEFKNNIANKKKMSDKEFQKKITSLEVKNADLKKRINEYLATDRMGYYDFREKCEYDMQCNSKDLYDLCNPLMAK